MSVSVNDHRKFLEGKLKEQEAQDAVKPVALLDQSEAVSVGDQNLDKLLRVLQNDADKHDKHAHDIALKGIGCVQDDMLKLQQFEYFYTKGKVDALKEAMLIPAQIMAELKVPEGTLVN
jgi:hypothetical protein